ncbi:protein of unassigned function [Methylobacterium oryzae CBMB20]|uniref:Protein of unassigned function n=1 Tax=Methylobacterium oryzae CBMB20 TaxID=693986 RepID=A0A089Q164_9HYPH|nr:protein of unassigned function [Methylobacterium oryzae CBMB20]
MKYIRSSCKAGRRNSSIWVLIRLGMNRQPELNFDHLRFEIGYLLRITSPS